MRADTGASFSLSYKYSLVFIGNCCTELRERLDETRHGELVLLTRITSASGEKLMQADTGTSFSFLINFLQFLSVIAILNSEKDLIKLSTKN